MDKTIIISSHLIKEVEEICDRALFIENGTLVKQYSSDSLNYYKIIIDEKRSIKIQRKYKLHRNNGELSIIVNKLQLNETLNDLVNQGIKILSIHEDRSRLEEAFLKRNE